MLIYKKIKSNCKDCGKTLLHRKDKKWSGRCKSCAASNHLKGNHFTLGHKLSESHKQKIRKNTKIALAGKKHLMVGRHHSEETKRRLSIINKGKVIPMETRIKMSLAQRGEKCPSWKGGISPKNERDRKTMEYRLWKKSCFERDNFIDQKTGERGGKLVVHHINNFADFPELRTSIENGITLSEKSHKEFHKIYGVKNNTREQLLEFLNK